MPTYVYECRTCGRFDVEQRVVDEPLTHCPKCGADVRRLIGSTSFVLKGSGWAKDGYAKGGGNGGKDSGGGKVD